MYVLSIKVPIRKKSGNLSYPPRIYYKNVFQKILLKKCIAKGLIIKNLLRKILQRLFLRFIENGPHGIYSWNFSNVGICSFIEAVICVITVARFLQNI